MQTDLWASYVNNRCSPFGRCTEVVKNEKIVGKDVKRLISFRDLIRIERNGYFIKENTEKVIIGTRVNKDTILLYEIEKKAKICTGKTRKYACFRYEVRFVNNHGTRQYVSYDSEPGDITGWTGTGGAIDLETFEAVLSDPKKTALIMELRCRAKLQSEKGLPHKFARPLPKAFPPK